MGGQAIGRRPRRGRTKVAGPAESQVTGRRTRPAGPGGPAQSCLEKDRNRTLKNSYMLDQVSSAVDTVLIGTLGS